MLYCDKHPKSFHREGFVKIMFHAIISKLKLSKFYIFLCLESQGSQGNTPYLVL